MPKNSTYLTLNKPNCLDILIACYNCKAINHVQASSLLNELIKSEVDTVQTCIIESREAILNYILNNENHLSRKLKVYLKGVMYHL